MKTEIHDGGPAFPIPGMSGLPNGEFLHPHDGMTLRDYFAAKAPLDIPDWFIHEPTVPLPRVLSPLEALRAAPQYPELTADDIASGRHFDFADPQPHQVEILDIAQALANECRYAGHTRAFYSVAQHSVMVSRLVPREHALEGLLHDAAEAYAKDIPSPLKALLADYRAVEHRIEAVIRQRFGLPAACSDAVKHADLVVLATERRDLMPSDPIPWEILRGIHPQERRLAALPPARAQAAFLRRWVELTDR